jgi:hypothetical protein
VVEEGSDRGHIVEVGLGDTYLPLLMLPLLPRLLLRIPHLLHHLLFHHLVRRRTPLPLI